MKNLLIVEDNVTYVVCNHRDGSKSLVQIDTEDIAAISVVPGSWCAHKTSAAAKTSYATAMIDGKTIYLHRLVMQYPEKGLIVDHISGDGLDCRKENLQLITQQANLAKSQLGHNSPVLGRIRGVKETASKRFEVTVRGKSYGTWDTLEKANQVATAKRNQINRERLVRAITTNITLQ